MCLFKDVDDDGDNFLLCMGGGQHCEQHRGEGEQSADGGEFCLC